MRWIPGSRRRGTRPDDDAAELGDVEVLGFDVITVEVLGADVGGVEVLGVDVSGEPVGASLWLRRQ